MGQGGTAADKEDARGRDKRIGILRHMSICVRVFRRVPQTTVKTRDGRSRYEREGETERERERIHIQGVWFTGLEYVYAQIRTTTTKFAIVYLEHNRIPEIPSSIAYLGRRVAIRVKGRWTLHGLSDSENKNQLIQNIRHTVFLYICTCVCIRPSQLA